MTPKLTVWLFSALLALVAAQSVPAPAGIAPYAGIQTSSLRKSQRQQKKSAPQQIKVGHPLPPQIAPHFVTNSAVAFLSGFNPVLFQRPPPVSSSARA